MSTSQQSSPLLQLGDDVLLEIRDAVKAPTAPKQTKTGRDLRSLRAFSQCNRRLRRILAPDVLSSIAIPQARDWTHAAEHLAAIAQSDDAPHSTRRPRLDMRTLEFDNSTAPHVVLLQMFMNDLPALLAHLTVLEHLMLRLPRAEALPFSALHAAVETTPLTLLALRALDMDAEMLALLPVCPNLRALRLHIAREWAPRLSPTDKACIRACAAVPQLRCFELCAPWDASVLALVHAALPRLTHLIIPGLHDAIGLADLLPTLSAFTSLTALTLPGVGALGIGFRPRERGIFACGRPDRAARQRVGEVWARAVEQAARMCFAACAALERVWVGERAMVMVRRGSGGEVAAVDVVEGVRLEGLVK